MHVQESSYIQTSYSLRSRALSKVVFGLYFFVFVEFSRMVIVTFGVLIRKLRKRCSRDSVAPSEEDLPQKEESVAEGESQFSKTGGSMQNVQKSKTFLDRQPKQNSIIPMIKKPTEKPISPPSQESSIRENPIPDCYATKVRTMKVPSIQESSSAESESESESPSYSNPVMTTTDRMDTQRSELPLVNQPPSPQR